VTLFGQSGGGAKVSHLLSMPAASGLFRQAIIESGAALQTGDPEQGTHVANLVLTQLGLTNTSIEKIHEVPTEALHSACDAVSAQVRSELGQAFVPVVDGHTHPAQLWAPEMQHLSAQVPLLVGYCDQDSSWGLGSLLQAEPASDAALKSLLLSHARRGNGRQLTESDYDHLIQHYRTKSPRSSRLDLLVRITTDLSLLRTSTLMTERRIHAGHAPTYLWDFDWQTPFMGGLWALHGIEIPFVFGNMHVNVAWDDNDTEAARNKADPKGVRFGLSDRALAAWASFARSGSPTTPALPTWPAYSLEQRSTMILAAQSRVLNDPSGAERKVIMEMTATSL
jgi:para-nitrobenzyl esterase